MNALLKSNNKLITVNINTFRTVQRKNPFPCWEAGSS